MGNKSDALIYLDLGLSAIPIKKGEKRPDCEWEKYQKELMTTEEADNYKWDGIGIVGGKVSKGLMFLDIDIKNDPEKRIGHDLKELIQKEMPNTWERLCLQKTPSGGFHALFFTDLDSEDFGYNNTGLAHHIDSNGKKAKIIETRFEGGQCLVEPSKGYEFVQHDPMTIPKLSLDETDQIIRLCTRLDRQPQKLEVARMPPSFTRQYVGGEPPWEAYNRMVASDEMLELLDEDGWKIDHKKGSEIRLTRPGKKKGTSGTLHTDSNIFYAWSSPTDIPEEKGVNAFQLYTHVKHGTDFSAAAKDLLGQGFGDTGRIEDVIKATEEKQPEVEIEIISDPSDDLEDVFVNGFIPGLTTGWPHMNDNYMMIPGQLNVVTGYPGSGKSEWMDSIAMNTAMEHGWNWLAYSPECYPPKLYLTKLAEKYTGKYMGDKEWNGYEKMNQTSLDEAKIFIGKHFDIISSEDPISLDQILAKAKEIMEKKELNGLIIDPWNELDGFRNSKQSETEYIGECLMKCRRFARKHGLNIWIVAHPAKPFKNKEEEDMSMYAISGSQHWYNKCDNGFIMTRIEDDNPTVSDINYIRIAKIKHRHYGKKGKLYFDFHEAVGIFTGADTPEKKAKKQEPDLPF